ncbi:hypothetical protein AMS68_005115 [Peltaster fructicola]|uniref:S1/P1 nuclease n=1 Tax=Peltaster fructicola TaxID=286661 RepID=A0A6H0XYC9_9PEZI|nr:hypothetical protein AMS68_005115 [Peltaster fructicola]
MLRATSWQCGPVLSLLFDFAYCWGNVGHRTVAYLAEAQLPPSARLQLSDLTGFDDVSDAAIWADTVTSEPSHKHTAPWHYINVDDSPPESCNVSTPVDWIRPNILTALINQTNIATHRERSKAEQQEAYRYIIHLVGDLHQPLHVEGLARGGVDIPVDFEGSPTNLHLVWDVNFITRLRRGMGADEKVIAKLWTKELLLKGDAKPTTAKCDSLNNARECFLRWARESNAKVCKHVLHEGLTNIENKELAGAYYETNVGVVEDAVYMAGSRLADWLLLVLENQHTAEADVHIHVDL